MRLLLTGARGSIGRVLSAGLADRGHQVRGLDLVALDAGDDAPDARYALGYVAGDCLDPGVVERAVAGVDAVAHFAGNPSEAALPESLESHVHSTARLLDAMVRHGLTRIVYASSNHAVGCTPRSELSTGTLGTGVRARPDTFYGVAKVAAEALLSLYADRAGIDAYALRIGSFLERPDSRRTLATWLSPGDCVRLVDAALTTEQRGFHVVYGVSANSAAWWDAAPGRAIGYRPVDDAAGFAEAVPERPGDHVEAAVVGGPMATGRHDQQPFDEPGP
jgi:uronate dehydrogenase